MARPATALWGTFLLAAPLLIVTPGASANHGLVCTIGELPVLCPGHECDDGADNDADGWSDFPNDPGCTGPDDDEDGNPACSDGVGNDGDGKVDYPADPGCSSIHDTSECNNWAYHAGAVVVTTYGSFVQLQVWWRADGSWCPGGILVDRIDYQECSNPSDGAWEKLYCMKGQGSAGGTVEGAWECAAASCSGKPSPHALRAEIWPDEDFQDEPLESNFDDCRILASDNIPESALDWACWLMDPPAAA